MYSGLKAPQIMRCSTTDEEAKQSNEIESKLSKENSDDNDTDRMNCLSVVIALTLGLFALNVSDHFRVHYNI